MFQLGEGGGAFGGFLEFKKQMNKKIGSQVEKNNVFARFVNVKNRCFDTFFICLVHYQTPSKPQKGDTDRVSNMSGVPAHVDGRVDGQVVDNPSVDMCGHGLFETLVVRFIASQ